MKTSSKILIVVLSLIPLMSEAQDLEIVSFSISPNEIISKKNQVKDGNGDACALVKVQVVDEINRVEGNIIGNVVDKGSEKWISLTQGTKFFTIHTQHHLPVRINCIDYNIPELKGKRVYVLRLKGDEPQIVKDTVIVEKEREVIKTVVEKGHTRFNVYLQPAVQAGMMMGYGGNIGFFISNFNIEAFITSTMKKETVNTIWNGSSVKENLSGLIIGGKVGYDIKIAGALRITPQAGLGSLSIRGDSLYTSELCITAGARLEYSFTPNFGISLTPEGQFAINPNPEKYTNSKHDIYKQLTEDSSKIKGWGTGFNIRLGLFVKF